jgi:GNAT superfamily N-acetyltransferase
MNAQAAKANSRPLLFTAGALRAYPLDREDTPLLQQFFDANPEYYLAVNGEPPVPDEAAREFADLPPPDLPFASNWMVGAFAADGRLVAVAHGLGDFIAAHVWHIGLFIVASDLHGTGTARVLHDGLEAWMRAQNARWVRLGVVQGNPKAERFWEKMGYRQVRERAGLATGRRISTVRVLVKPLADESLDVYLARVMRDRPGAP